ncbi:MAG: hypothetical protein AB7F86_16845 [Bdellovibrionales bacterium]
MTIKRMSKTSARKTVGTDESAQAIEKTLLSRLDPTRKKGLEALKAIEAKLAKAKPKKAKKTKGEGETVTDDSKMTVDPAWTIPVTVEMPEEVSQEMNLGAPQTLTESADLLCQTCSASGHPLKKFIFEANEKEGVIRIKNTEKVIKSATRAADLHQGEALYMRSVLAYTNGSAENNPQPTPTPTLNNLIDPEIIALCSNQPQTDQPLAKSLATNNLDDVTWQDFTSYKLLLEKPSYRTTATMPAMPTSVDVAIDSTADPASTQMGNDPFFMDFFRIVLHNNGASRIAWPRTGETLWQMNSFFADAHSKAIGAAGLWSKLFLMYYAIPDNLMRLRFLKLIVPPEVRDYEIEIKWLENQPTIPGANGAPPQNQPPIEHSSVLKENPFRLYYNVRIRTSNLAARGHAINQVPYGPAGLMENVHMDLVQLWPGVVARALEMWEARFETDYETFMNAMFKTAPLDYPFHVVQPEHINFGVRFTHRQEWRPLGLQRGEIVRTVPLGPKQVQKISTRQLSREKMSSTSERTRDTESNTETSQSGKDSTDVVEETAKSFGWKVEAEASYSSPLNAGGPGIKISGGAHGEDQTNTKAASQHLTETMQKVSSKLRTQSKIVISTESESSFEQNFSSEIQNPNDEVAVTFIYSKLQRQYEVLTSLASIDNVICVAEELPDPWEVSNEWVRRHGWILAKNLLDESFRPALEGILNGVPPLPMDPMAQEKLDLAMDSATRGIESLANGPGQSSLSQVDVVQEAQRAYRESQKERTKAEYDRSLAEAQSDRFLEHLRENILHYCRAVWAAESPEQRLLRYEKRGLMVPTQWAFLPATGGRINVDSIMINNYRGQGFRGSFIPHPTTPDYVPLIELINPFSTVSYVGNYAVFQMKSPGELRTTQTNDLFPILSIIHSLYEDPGRPGQLMDPSLREAQDLVKQENPNTPDRLPAEIDRATRELMVDMVPKLRAKFTSMTMESREAFLEGSVDAFKPFYADFRYRYANARRMVVDTNNLVVDIEKGSGTVLEQFKVLHRALDVKKAAAESANAALDYKRRQLLIDAGRYGDPDIEKVIAVSGIEGMTVNVDPGN